MAVKFALVSGCGLILYTSLNEMKTSRQWASLMKYTCLSGACMLIASCEMPAKELFGGYISSSDHHSLQPTVLGLSCSADRLDVEVDIQYSIGQ